MKKNIIITGLPRSGKTTLLKEIVKLLDDTFGFVTNEIRKDGERTGFEVETHLGKTSLVSYIYVLYVF